MLYETLQRKNRRDKQRIRTSLTLKTLHQFSVAAQRIIRTHAVHHGALGLLEDTAVTVERLRSAETQRGAGEYAAVDSEHENPCRETWKQEFTQLKISAPRDKFDLQRQHRRYYNVITQVQLLWKKNKDCCENRVQCNYTVRVLVLFMTFSLNTFLFVCLVPRNSDALRTASGGIFSLECCLETTGRSRWSPRATETVRLY